MSNGSWEEFDGFSSCQERYANECAIRSGGNSFHVEYICVENKDLVSQSVKNITHQKVTSEHDIPEAGFESSWILDGVREGAARLMVSISQEDLEIDQILDEKTLFQLSDMFRRGAVLLRLNREEKDRREAEENFQKARLERERQSAIQEGKLF